MDFQAAKAVDTGRGDSPWASELQSTAATPNILHCLLVKAFVLGLQGPFIFLVNIYAPAFFSEHLRPFPSSRSLLVGLLLQGSM